MSDYQRFAHQFLLESFQTRTYLNYSGQQWKKQVTPTQDCGDAVLTIFGQAINFHQLEGMLDHLGDSLILHRIKRHSLCNVYGDTVLRADVSIQDEARLKARMGQASEAFHLDAGIQRQQPRLKEPGLLVMDMDSTVIQIECIDEIAALADRKEEVAKVTEQAMQGKLDFDRSLVQRVSCLKGVEVARLEQIRNRLPLTAGIQILIKELKMRNWRLAIASGGFTFFADYLCQRLGLDDAVANQLEASDGKLTGRVSGAIVNGQTKAETIERLAKAYDVPHRQTIAAGDGANDLPMMHAASLGVACHAKPTVNDQAGVSIRHCGLHAMLYYLDV
ncbi:phosphoserine phosphatase SerB [Salinimonas marina]|uniref:Phosphoserine phosphatase n=2 Tax=Salinimonas marina TaxID=2785918 RepID=A0A7S9E065_9ALTE|nr:phosphoserine phosphatase SerB [Salinimonas marina]